MWWRWWLRWSVWPGGWAAAAALCLLPSISRLLSVPVHKIPGKLEKQITTDIGPIAKFKEDFIQAGVTQFGSGWAWLAVKDGKLAVMKTANGESPLVQGAKPILGCDVWEHSYYIDYRNRRPDYLKAFCENLINWDYVNEMFQAASK